MVLPLAAAVALVWTAAHAGTSPDVRCQARKLVGAARSARGLLRCDAVAASQGAGVDDVPVECVP